MRRAVITIEWFGPDKKVREWIENPDDGGPSKFCDDSCTVSTCSAPTAYPAASHDPQR